VRECAREGSQSVPSRALCTLQKIGIMLYVIVIFGNEKGSESGLLKDPTPPLFSGCLPFLHLRVHDRLLFAEQVSLLDATYKLEPPAGFDPAAGADAHGSPELQALGVKPTSRTA